MMKDLVGKKMTKKVKFMDDSVQISKLSVKEVMAIQREAEGLADEDSFDMIVSVIRKATEGADEVSDEEFEMFPIDELSKLSNEIMKFSGVTPDAGKQ